MASSNGGDQANKRQMKKSTLVFIQYNGQRIAYSVEGGIPLKLARTNTVKNTTLFSCQPTSSTTSPLLTNLYHPHEMAEPQPPNIREGATDLEEETPALPANAEDRKAAAALSALKDQGNEDDGQKADVDQEALGKAMGQLNVKDEEKKKEEGRGKEGERKKVKVDAGDIALLVSKGAITIFFPTQCAWS